MTGLPRGWAETTLGETGDYLNGRGFKKSEWREQGRPIIRIQNLTGSGQGFNHFDGEPEDRYTARDGDVLLSWAATLGVFVWRGPEAVVNQHIFKVESRIDRDFHRYLLEATLAELRREAHGSGMIHITRPRFEATPVLVPPLEEQRRIVAVIEEQFSRLDAAGASVVRARHGLRRLRESLLADLALVAPSRPLAEIAQLTDGPFGSNLKSSNYTPGGPRVVRLQNIGDGVFLDERAHIDPAHYSLLEKYAVFDGDLVAASLGESAPRACQIPAWLGPAIVKADCIRIRPAEELLPRFLMWVLNSPPTKRVARGFIKGVGRPRLGVSGLKKLPIPVPSLDDQRALLDQIERRLSVVDTMFGAAAGAERSSSALRRSILDRAFRGELVPQDPSDEPASVLLERMRAEKEAQGNPPRPRRRAGTAQPS